ncbi:ice-binding protein [Flavobacterium sp. XS2P39]|uniref:ice-binding protein n=1 Tax=Flavobacterium sp. XS2P39 TaxID=3401725 RepID=UPI003AAC7014
MKFKNALPTLALLLIVFMSSCNNEMEEDLSTNMSSLEKSSSLTYALTKTIEPLSNIGGLKGVNLGVSGDFAILSKTGITDVYKSAVTGDVGSSPITGAAILLKCEEVTGTIYTVDAAGPLPCRLTNATRLTTAIGDMQTAYTDAAGRLNPDFLNLGAGNIGGKTLTPGLYKWTSAVKIPTDITIAGGPDDVWIFQISGTLNMSSAVRITLADGAQAKNIYWQITDSVTLGTTSHFEGNILGQTAINLQTGASINGRLLAQTAVTLQMNAVTQPK